MKINPHSASINTCGINLQLGDKLEDLRTKYPHYFTTPLLSNFSYESFQLENEDEKASILFKNNIIYQVSYGFHIKNFAEPFSEKLALMEKYINDQFLLNQFGKTKIVFENGSIIESCFDPRSMSSSIIILYPHK